MEGPRAGRQRALAPLLAALVALLVLAGPAAAELSQSGDLFVHFDGGITPRALPRRTPAPVAVRIEGTIRTPARHAPPALRRITVALNRGGQITTSGLPICHQDMINAASPAGALAACGPALIGGGGFTAKTAISGQPSVVTSGEILLFNSTDRGHATILGLVYERKPVLISRILVFHIRHTRGTFGTVLTARLPTSLNQNGYLKSIFLKLQRSYSFRGRPESYLTASCATPPGIRVATFPFARASMSFEGGRILSAKLTRTCTVRG